VTDKDNSPLPTDFENISELTADMENFAKDNPTHVFISADDPGYNHNPPRVPRRGWSAFIPNTEDERPKSWTITIQNLMNSGGNLSFSSRITSILRTRQLL
jgi:hypothetical protein